MVDKIVYVKSRSVRKVEIMFIGHKEITKILKLKKKKKRFFHQLKTFGRGR